MVSTADSTKPHQPTNKNRKTTQVCTKKHDVSRSYTTPARQSIERACMIKSQFAMGYFKLGRQIQYKNTKNHCLSQQLGWRKWRWYCGVTATSLVVACEWFWGYISIRMHMPQMCTKSKGKDTKQLVYGACNGCSNKCWWVSCNLFYQWGAWQYQTQALNVDAIMRQYFYSMLCSTSNSAKLRFGMLPGLTSYKFASWSEILMAEFRQQVQRMAT